MNIKKTFALLLSAAALCTVFLAGCNGGSGNGPSGGGGNNVPGGTDGETDELQTYTLEAEYVNLENKQGAGISSDQGGVEMIYGQGTEEEKTKGWSNGYYVGYTYSPYLTLDFEFESSKAASAVIILRLGSELGAISLDPTSFSVKLNETEIEYQSMYIETSKMDAMKFYDKTVAVDARLKEGKNVITLEILPNNFKNGATGGPMIDCVKLETEAKITWQPRTENPSNRGGSIF